MQPGRDCQSQPANALQFLALRLGVVDLEDIDPLHQVGPAERERIHPGSNDDVLCDAIFDGLLQGLLGISRPHQHAHGDRFYGPQHAFEEEPFQRANPQDQAPEPSAQEPGIGILENPHAVAVMAGPDGGHGFRRRGFAFPQYLRYGVNSRQDPILCTPPRQEQQRNKPTTRKEADPTPFVWIKTTDEIMDGIGRQRLCQAEVGSRVDRRGSWH